MAATSGTLAYLYPSTPSSFHAVINIPVNHIWRQNVRSSEMRLENISKESKHVLDAMRRLIEKEGETDHLRKDEIGWQYGGGNFLGLVDSLREKMKEELKTRDIHVAGCTVRHFLRGANITPSDPAKRLLIIPINGVSMLYPPGSQLPLDTYCFIDNRPTLSGENIDVVFVAYEAPAGTI